MNTILKFGFGTTLFLYIMFSLGNHSWDPMLWESPSNYFFGTFSAMGFLTGMMVVVLGLDQDINKRK